MNWTVITGSLLSIPVLMFFLGVIAASIKTDLRLLETNYFPDYAITAWSTDVLVARPDRYLDDALHDDEAK